jgi:hypothetical protein
MLETLLKNICRKVPYGFLCGSDDFFRPTEIDAHVAFLSSGESNDMVGEQVSIEDVAKCSLGDDGDFQAV